MSNREESLRKILVVRWDRASSFMSSEILHGFLEWLEPRFHAIFGVFSGPVISNRYLIQKIWPYPVIEDRHIPLLASFEDSELTVISFTSPDKFYQGGNSRNIGYFTWTAPLPPDGSWVSRMNCLEEIWTPALFLKEFLLTERVKVPVRYAPCPPRALRYSEDDDAGDRGTSILLEPILPKGDGEAQAIPLKRLKEKGGFLVASTLNLRPRKGLSVLIEGWLESRESREILRNSALILIPIETEPISDQLCVLKRIVRSLFCWHVLESPSIFVVSNRSDFSAFKTVLHHCSAYVTTSFGEVVLEEILHPLFLGKPVICPNNSVFLEYFQGDYPYFIRTDQENVSLGGEEALSISASWGIPQEGALGEAFEKVCVDLASDRDKGAVSTVGQKIRQRIEESLGKISL